MAAGSLGSARHLFGTLMHGCTELVNYYSCTFVEHLEVVG